MKIFPSRRVSTSYGYTMAELLIVIAIIGIIAAILLLVNWRKSVYRAYDAQRKADVVQINRAFEEYFNDNGCYPELDIINECGGNDLAPFIDKIPCDPTTGEPYQYVAIQETNVCLGNRVCAKLQDWNDPDITALGCDGENGCGWGAYWNYCLSTGGSVTPSGFDPDAEPTPTPSPTPSLFGPYACRPGTQFGGIVVFDGSCNNVGDPTAFECPFSFAEDSCQDNCGNLNYWCRR